MDAFVGAGPAFGDNDGFWEGGRKKICKTLPMWKEFDGIVHDYFYGKKLTDLL